VLLPLWSVGKGRKNILSKEQLSFNHAIAQTINLLITSLDSSIIFILENYREDKVVIENIYKEIKEKQNVSIVDKKFTVDENLNFISQIDVLISMRLHPLILASLVRTPFVGIIAHLKVANFLLQVKEREQGVPYERLNPKEFNKKIEGVLKRSNQVKKELNANVEALRQKAILNAELAKKLIYN